MPVPVMDFVTNATHDGGGQAFSNSRVAAAGFDSPPRDVSILAGVNAKLCGLSNKRVALGIMAPFTMVNVQLSPYPDPDKYAFLTIQGGTTAWFALNEFSRVIGLEWYVSSGVAGIIRVIEVYKV